MSEPLSLSAPSSPVQHCYPALLCDKRTHKHKHITQSRWPGVRLSFPSSTQRLPCRASSLTTGAGGFLVAPLLRVAQRFPPTHLRTLVI